MSSEKDESYWIGVRDALRMVDSFLRWARRNPTIAKSLDEFLAEGLVAAAKRCESCLGRELGLKYGKEDPEKGQEDSIFDEETPAAGMHDAPADAVSSPEEDFSDITNDTVLDDISMAPPSEEAIPELEEDIPLLDDATIDEGALVDALSDVASTEPMESSIPGAESREEELPESSFIESIESATRDASIDDLDRDIEPGEFTSDFELAEPEPLEIELEGGDAEESEVVSPIEFEETEVESTAAFESDTPDRSDEDESISSFGSTSPETEDSSMELSEMEQDDSELSSESIPKDDPQSALSSLAEIWNPYDESTSPDDELATDEDEPSLELISEEDVPEEAPPSPRKVPPPPPPPETDETEEERRKRARRLFFGT